MISCSSIEVLSKHILALREECSSNPMIVLVGGCSRTGKTVLVSKLMEYIKSSEISTTVIKLDSWLVSLEKRKEDSSVLERYETSSIILSIKKLLRGETVLPPIYDAISRRRIAESGLAQVSITNGILFVDGVVALAIEELLKHAALRIFVDIPDTLRKQRLVHFYSEIKRLDEKECESIIKTREKEEVLFIKKTVVNADITFNNLELK